MRLSHLHRILIRGADGKPSWKEVSQLTLPKGGKQLSFLSGVYLVIVGAFGLVCYAQTQEALNPKSKWGGTAVVLLVKEST